jgi:type I restriction enzyme S subunit
MSQTVKPGFKQTEVGVIPEEWKVKEIGSVCGTITTGKLDANAMRPDGPYRFYTCAKDYYQIDKFAFDCEALLISGNGAHVGYIHYYHGKFNAYQRTYVLFGFRDDIKFIQHYLSENFKKRIEVEVKAGGTPYITRPTIAETALPIPPLPEQRAIATALSDVDALLAALDRLIAKQHDLKQAAMQQLLTGQTRLPGFTGKWVPLNMADNSTLKARIGWQGLTTAEYLSIGDYFLVTGTDFSDGRIAWSTCCFVAPQRYTQDRNIQLRSKDILLTKDGTIGKVAFVDNLRGPATLNSGVFVIRPKDGAYDPQFFYYILTSRVFDEFLNKLAAGSTISHLYQKDFVTFSFLAPPTIPEQTAIATVLSDMDLELAALEQRRDKTRALKQGMMQELLTGRTRLI